VAFVEKDVVEGGAVEPGMRLYRIAPLDPIWVEAEVYADLPPVSVARKRRSRAHCPNARLRHASGMLPSPASETRRLASAWSRGTATRAAARMPADVALRADPGETSAGLGGDRRGRAPGEAVDRGDSSSRVRPGRGDD
jgi:hypothetical protein